MIVLAWNCRGLGRATTVRSLRVLTKAHKPHILFISELKSASQEKMKKNFYISWLSEV